VLILLTAVVSISCCYSRAQIILAAVLVDAPQKKSLELREVQRRATRKIGRAEEAGKTQPKGWHRKGPQRPKRQGERGQPLTGTEAGGQI